MKMHNIDVTQSNGDVFIHQESSEGRVGIRLNPDQAIIAAQWILGCSVAASNSTKTKPANHEATGTRVFESVGALTVKFDDEDWEIRLEQRNADGGVSVTRVPVGLVDRLIDAIAGEMGNLMMEIPSISPDHASES